MHHILCGSELKFGHGFRLDLWAISTMYIIVPYSLAVTPPPLLRSTSTEKREGGVTTKIALSPCC